MPVTVTTATAPGHVTTITVDNAGYATAARADATAAEASATAAATSAAAAATSATSAANSVTSAANSVTSAANSATAAAGSATAAAADRALVESARDLVEDDRAEVEANKNLTYGYAQDVASAIVYQDLASIAASKTVTAVDVFVYDTSKDSDGGAWRHRCAGTSWFNEPLNTATRGARREFPAVAVIVAESNKVTIYDGDDPALPMWMTATVSSTRPFYGTDLKSAHAVNGILSLGSNSATTGALTVVSFIEDTITAYSTERYRINQNISQRETAASFALLSATSIVNRAVNDVAMSILPDAPLDPATGLPVPTIAVATAGGVSVIEDNGTVDDSAKTTGCTDLAIDRDGRLRAVFGDGDMLIYDLAAITGDGFGGTVINGASTPARLGAPTSAAARSLGSVSGLSLLSPGNGMVAHVTSAYATGWMPGAIRGAFLASNAATALVGGTDADRSSNGNDLTVNGTIIRAPVATGAELVAYGPFPSLSDYLSQPYNSALDFGTGDFCVMGWIEWTSGGPNIQVPLAKNELGNNLSPYFELQIVGGALSWVSSTGVNRVAFGSLPSGRWQHIVYTRVSGVGSAYLNGQLVQSKADANNYNHAGADSLLIGRRGEDFPCASTRLSLFRIGATAPTADQIRRIYEDEKALFQENAACTLYGASNAVTALAHDPDTGLLHVGTSAGRSVFQGLRRVANTTTPVVATISASGDMVVED